MELRLQLPPLPYRPSRSGHQISRWLTGKGSVTLWFSSQNKFHTCLTHQHLDFIQIDTLSRVNHKNFVNLIGYCEEDEPFTRMMVFEYAPNGTLFEHLHGKNDYFPGRRTSDHRISFARFLFCSKRSWTLGLEHEGEDHYGHRLLPSIHAPRDKPSRSPQQPQLSCDISNRWLCCQGL